LGVDRKASEGGGVKLNPKNPLRTDMDSALAQIELLAEQHEKVANGFYTPQTIWQVFEKHALLIIGGSLLGASLMYLAAFLRGL
jgi:hypothetical protein